MQHGCMQRNRHKRALKRGNSRWSETAHPAVMFSRVFTCKANGEACLTDSDSHTWRPQGSHREKRTQRGRVMGRVLLVFENGEGNYL